MPLGSTSAAFGTAVQSLAYGIARKLVVTLPVVGALDLTANLVSHDGPNESDTSSYPDDLTDKSGIENTAGAVVLAGSVVVNGSSVSIIRLFNPDDSASPLYRQQLGNSPLTLSLGAMTTQSGVQAPEFVDFYGYVTTTETDVSAGTVTVNWSDVPPGWSNLPSIDAVMTAPPYNAGLTSEFVIDRIARAASGGSVSSWPAQRSGCVLAAGMRSSSWAEVGALDTTTAGLTLFSTGQFGTALAGAGTYTLATPITGVHVTVEFWATGSSGSPTVFVSSSASNAPPFVEVQLNYATGQLNVTFETGAAAIDTYTAFTGVAAGEHYILAHVHVPTSGTPGSWSADVTLDGASVSSGSRTIAFQSSVPAGGYTNALAQGQGGTIEALQVTTESSPASNYGFTPKLKADPSLNPLQAVPAIDAGADAYSELQTVAEAEGGYLAFRSGVLTFLNRNTIAQQASTRTVTALTSLKSLESATAGSFQTFDDILIDWTEYTWAKAAVVYQPASVWKIPARSSVTFTRTLANGVTVGAVDGSISYCTRDSQSVPPGTNQSELRASLDRNGVNEIPDTSKVYGTVQAVSPSEIAITITNKHSADVFLASPSDYTFVTVGTPSLWINGIAVTPDNPTTQHVNDPLKLPTSSTYTVPTNQYRQDRDASYAFGQFLLFMLWAPQVLYGAVSIVPDHRITCGDRITLDVPVDGGVTSLDVLVWGVTRSSSFEAGQVSEEMTLDVRAIAAPGAWVVGKSVTGTSTYVY